MLDKVSDFVALLRECKDKQVCLDSLATLYLLSVGKITYPSDLCVMLGMLPSQASRILTKLRESNRISEVIDGQDRRRILVKITSEGIRWLRGALLDLKLKV